MTAAMKKDSTYFHKGKICQKICKPEKNGLTYLKPIKKLKPSTQNSIPSRTIYINKREIKTFK